MTVTILTAVYDHYDPLPDVAPQSIPCELVCVTDDPDLDTDRWTILHVPSELPPRLAAKAPKLQPFDYVAADVVIWIDAAYHVTSPLFAETMADLDTDLAQFAHPDRDCVYAEAHAAAPMARYAGHSFDPQLADYRALGLPEHAGLWACTLMVRRDTGRQRALGIVWAAEMARYGCPHDQHTWAAVCWKCGVRPHELPGTHLDNPWLEHRPSARHFS